MTIQASQGQSGSVQQTTQQTAQTSTEIPTSDDMEMMDLDALIPKDLRDAVNKTEKTAKTSQQQQQQQQKVVKTKAAESIKADDDDTSDDDSQTDDDSNTDDSQTDDTEGDDDEDLDLSPENIDNLIKDPNNIVKKPQEDEKPSWHEDNTYKQLLTKLKFSNITPTQIDKIIVDAIDKKVLKDADERNTLSTELEQLKTKDQLQSAEIDRLKNIERTAFFDTMPETQKTYREPLGQLQQSMKAVLDMEGANVSVQQIVSAKNKAEFTELTKDIDFDDATLTKLTNYWRSYKELEFKYVEDRKSAQQNLRKHLSFNISDENANNLFKSSLIEFSRSDERYAYVRKAIQEGLVGHEHVSKILGIAKANFLNIIRAVSNPVDYSKNVTWLDGVAKFALDAAHSAHVEDNYGEVVKQNEALTTNLKKVIKAYKQLYGSAKGITGKKGTIVNNAQHRNGNDESSKKDKEDFEKLLSNRLDVSEILPTLGE